PATTVVHVFLCPPSLGVPPALASLLPLRRAPTRSPPLSLHDALPISLHGCRRSRRHRTALVRRLVARLDRTALRSGRLPLYGRTDRKSTRLNSSHVSISYAVFCLKKKKEDQVVAEQNRQALHAHELEY